MIGKEEQKALFEKFFLINFVQNGCAESQQKCERLIGHLQGNYPTFSAEAQAFAEEFCGFLRKNMSRLYSQLEQSPETRSRL